MKVLFVSTINTCRSPMAEEIFNKLKKDANLKANSAGITVVKDSFVSENSVQIIKKELNIDIKNKEATQLRRNLVEDADLILTMSKYGRDFIKENYPNSKDKVFTICEYAGVNGEVFDPYGSTISVYEKIYKELKELISIVLVKLKEDGSV